MSGRELSGAGDKLEPGAALAEAREALGITQREVSDALNLPMATVEAIETNDQTHLPAPVFTRGYVRAYAKLLEIDAEPLVAAMGDDQAGEEAPRQSGAEGAVVTAAAGTQFDVAALLQPKYLGAAAASVAALALLIWVLAGDDAEIPAQAGPAGTDQIDAKQDVPSTPLTELVQAEAPERPMPAVSEVTDQAEEEEESEDVAVPEEAPAVAATDNTPSAAPLDQGADAAAALQEAAAAKVAVADDPARRLTATGEDRLSLEFTEECWVEIKDTQGQLLFGNLGRAGQRLEFVGAAPFRLLLGYAPGVLLSFNSEPVALTPHTRNNVASLVLGQ